MSTPEQNESKLTVLTRELEMAQAAFNATKHLYALARKNMMDAALRKRDYDFCHSQGLLDGYDDESLGFEVVCELDSARHVFNLTKEVLFSEERAVSRLREKIRKHRK